MLQQAFAAVRYGQQKARMLGSWLSLSYTAALCPPDARPALAGCLKEAEDFRVRLTAMIAGKSDELEFIVMQGGYAEQDQVFKSYDVMMDFFKNLDEDAEYPHTNYLRRTAANFIRSFDDLPEAVAHALNRSLKVQLTMIERNFRGIFHEAVINAFELR